MMVVSQNGRHNQPLPNVHKNVALLQESLLLVAGVYKECDDFLKYFLASWIEELCLIVKTPCREKGDRSYLIFLSSFLCFPNRVP